MTSGWGTFGNWTHENKFLCFSSVDWLDSILLIVVGVGSAMVINRHGGAKPNRTSGYERSKSDAGDSQNKTFHDGRR